MVQGFPNESVLEVENVVCVFVHTVDEPSLHQCYKKREEEEEEEKEKKGRGTGRRKRRGMKKRRKKMRRRERKKEKVREVKNISHKNINIPGNKLKQRINP